MGIVGGALERSVLARRRNFTIATRGTIYARPRAEVTATNACAFVGGSALGIRDTHGVAAIANVRTQLPPSSGGCHTDVARWRCCGAFAACIHLAVTAGRRALDYRRGAHHGVSFFADEHFHG